MHLGYTEPDKEAHGKRYCTMGAETNLHTDKEVRVVKAKNERNTMGMGEDTVGNGGMAGMGIGGMGMGIGMGSGIVMNL